MEFLYIPRNDYKIKHLKKSERLSKLRPSCTCKTRINQCSSKFTSLYIQQVSLKLFLHLVLNCKIIMYIVKKFQLRKTLILGPGTRNSNCQSWLYLYLNLLILCFMVPSACKFYIVTHIFWACFLKHAFFKTIASVVKTRIV